MKLRYQNQSEVPAELAAHYTQRDGAFVLNVEGAADPAQLEQLHSANLALTKELDEHQQRFQGIDPDAARKLETEKRQLEEAQQLKAGEFEKVLETRLQAAKADFKSSSRPSASERDSLTDQLAKIQIDQAVLTAATERGLHRSAVPDLLGRAHSHLPHGQRRAHRLRARRQNRPPDQRRQAAPARAPGSRTSSPRPRTSSSSARAAPPPATRPPRPLPRQPLPQGHLEPHRTNAPAPTDPAKAKALKAAAQKLMV